MLAARGDTDEAIDVLRRQMLISGSNTRHRLAALLKDSGREAEADRLVTFGLNPDGSTADEPT